MKKWEVIVIFAFVIVGIPIIYLIFNHYIFMNNEEFTKTLSSFSSMISAILVLVASNSAAIRVEDSAIIRNRVNRIKLCTFSLLVYSIITFFMSILAIPFVILRIWAFSFSVVLFLLTPILLGRAIFMKDKDGQ